VETTTVNRITDQIVAEVEQLSFAELVAILNVNVGLYASREGNQLTLANDPEVETKLPERERFFGIKLSRNEDISPVSRDNAAGFIAFQIKVVQIIHAPAGSLTQGPLDRTLAVFNSAVTKRDS